MTSPLQSLSLPDFPKLRLTLSDVRLLDRSDRPVASALEQASALRQRLNDSLSTSSAPLDFEGLHIGNEFCERLLPSAAQLRRAAAWCDEHGRNLTLVTPLLADRGIQQLTVLLPLLPPQSEVVCNDFGVIHLLRDRFPALQPIAGRQLVKMIKDPRLPSATWAAATPPGMRSSLFAAFMERLGISRLETEVRPFPQEDDLKPCGLRLSVHFPYGYILKGRICKPGSMHLEPNRKFTPGHTCRKECLTYFSRMERTRPKSSGELDSFMRGNTIFYRYGEEQLELISRAIEKGWIEHLIIPGDWHENRRPD